MDKDSVQVAPPSKAVAVKRKKKDKDRVTSGWRLGRSSTADGLQQQQSDAGAESSDSDVDTEQHSVMRKVSTRKQIRSKVSVKEGYLLLQISSASFQKWRRHYFKLRPRRLFYAKTKDAEIFHEVALADCSVAERSTKNVNCSFSIITPLDSLILCAESRREMDEWISGIKTVQSGEFYEPRQFFMENFSGGHNWYTSTHARPTYCNVCREVLNGVTNHGLSCEVCKFKAHKRCAAKAINVCKWSTLSTVGKHIIEDEDGVWIPHQWMEGNLPVSAKCVVCDKTCGSVLRLQDWRCLWCRAMVHTSCRSQLPQTCSLGPCRMSVVPPAALNSMDSDGYWQAIPSGQCSSPLLVFVNSKSGDNQGVKFFRRFRQHLNPAQVFDLMCTGPRAGLRMFSKFGTFRILVCGGDGSIGWVLTEMDKMNLHKSAQVGVLPLGTGNDLAQVMGWGNVCDDDTQVPAILERYERASAKLLDRWSIMAYEGPVRPMSSPLVTEGDGVEPSKLLISEYEPTVAKYLSTILNSDKNSEVLKSAAVLCNTIKDFVSKVKSEDDVMAEKCRTLTEKVNSLVTTLNEESKVADEEQKRQLRRKNGWPKHCQGDSVLEDVQEGEMESQEQSGDDRTSAPNDTEDGDDAANGDEKAQEVNKNETTDRTTRPKRVAVFHPREQIMLRVNSLKKAVRQIIEHTEKAIDEQNEQSLQSKLASQPEEDESAAPQIQIALESSQKLSLQLSVESSTSTAEASSLSSKPSVSSCEALTIPPQQFPRLSPKVKVRGLGGSLQPAKDRHSMKMNPDFGGGGTFIGRVLFANADAMCAAVSPLVNFPCPILNEMFSERCVMNNYFGIGLDAKIALDFHRKREEHPKNCSRTKNMVWFGMMGAREIALKTYKNLEQRIRLECDGQYIPLPRLQGIVVLNIPSFMGGTNFWGGRTGNQTFVAPSYNDRVLEVVAVFGTMQLGMAMVAPEGVFQQHRIAQCRTIKITILGDEGVPLQVDGEAWLQPPGVVKIEYKNRAQMLSRDRHFEETLKSWEDKQHRYVDRHLSVEYLNESELEALSEFSEAVSAVVKNMHDQVKNSNMLSEDLLSYVVAVQRICAKMRPCGHLSDATSRSHVSDLVSAVADLSSMLTTLLDTRSEELGDMSQKLAEWLEWTGAEMKKLNEIKWLANIMNPTPSEETMQKQRSRFRLGPFLKKTQKKEQRMVHLNINVNGWTLDEVGQWLDTLQLGEYKDVFARHDVRGEELLKLESGDVKGMGITKVGHIKRIQTGIKDLQKAMNRISR